MTTLYQSILEDLISPLPSSVSSQNLYTKQHQFSKTNFDSRQLLGSEAACGYRFMPEVFGEN